MSPRRFVAAMSMALAIVAPSSARADDGSAQAEALYGEGRRLMKAGDLHAACSKFEESQRIDPASGTLTALALCHEREGRTASAWSEFSALIAEAHRAGRADREALGREHAAALEARLSRLTIVVDSASATLPGLVVHRDEVVVGPATWGVPIPVDSGEHVVTVEATGKVAWTTRVTVGARADQVAVAVPALEDVPAPASPAPEAPRNAPSLAAAPVPDPRTTRRAWGLGVGGVGIVGLGVGAYFGVSALSASQRVRGACPGGTCARAEDVSLAGTARTDALVADIALIAGAVALGTGTYLTVSTWIGRRPTTAQWQVLIGPNGASVAGSW